MLFTSPTCGRVSGPQIEKRGENSMIRRTLFGLLCAGFVLALCSAGHAQSPQPTNRQWAGYYDTQDWQRFYHYPYVTYPQNYWGSEYYRSTNSLYYRYPAEMQIPVYNKAWHNEYPQPRRYHQGHEFILDVF